MGIELGRKRMVFAIAVLAALSVLIIILESTHLRTHRETHKEDIHDSHPILKEKLKAADKCWIKETFEVVENCEVCSDPLTDPLVCVAKGNREKVKCDSGKEAYRSCDTVDRIEERKFWIFETVMTLVAGVSYGALFLRQKQMDHRMYQKIQRQIAAGV